jgi:CheY-like chemotaxis protein
MLARTNASLEETAEQARALAVAAQAADRAKSDFLATMSHEIRTPLNGVLGYADLLLNDDALVLEQRRYVERIQTAGTALLTVVNDVLDFSRIEAGQIELEPVAFSPGVLLQNAVSIVKPLADERGLALDVAIEPVLPEHLIGDQDRLQQVLLNLLNNAIKFTPEGRIDLTISVENCTPRECTFRAEVADTGIGIAQDKQGRLFQQFSQVDGSIRRQYGGTGLGLAISRRLVELMGGRIGVTSALGQGARFWFSVTLPRAEQSQADPAPTQPSPGPGRSARILLVEDNEINQEIARTLLGAAGHQVDLAPDGAVAIKSVQSHAYDLVLMDVQMPVMDGITAAKHIRMLEGGERYLPIIALTANVLPQQVRAFTDAGMDDHIAKPFRKETLLACVDRWLVSERSPPEGVPLL